MNQRQNNQRYGEHFFEEEDYYKPVRDVNFYSKSYIEYERNGDGKPYQSKNTLMKLKQCMKNFINNLQKSGTWEIQLTIAINFFSFKTLMQSVRGSNALKE